MKNLLHVSNRQPAGSGWSYWFTHWVVREDRAYPASPEGVEEEELAKYSQPVKNLTKKPHVWGNLNGVRSIDRHLMNKPK
jgi:hypothetical protein